MIIILMGVTGAGKTAIGKMLAEELEYAFYEGDEFHSQNNIEKMNHGIPLDDNDRLPWLLSIRGLIENCAQEKKNAVITCSALKSSYRSILIKNENEINLIYLKGDRDMIQTRLETRKNHFMNPGLLASQFDILEEPKNAIYADISKDEKTIVESIRLKLLGGQKNDI